MLQRILQYETVIIYYDNASFRKSNSNRKWRRTFQGSSMNSDTYSLDSQLKAFLYDAAQPVSSFILWSSMDKLSKTSEIKNLAFQVKLLKFPVLEIFQSIGLQYRHTVWHQSSKSTVFLGLLTTAYAIWSCVRIRINLSFFEYIFSCLQNPC